MKGEPERPFVEGCWEELVWKQWVATSLPPKSRDSRKPTEVTACSYNCRVGRWAVMVLQP